MYDPVHGEWLDIGPFPTVPDLPVYGWIWYHESDQVDTSAKESDLQ